MTDGVIGQMNDPATLIYDDSGLVCVPLGNPHYHRHAIHHSHIRFFTPVHPNIRHHHGYVHHCHIAHHAHCFWDLGGPAGGGAGDVAFGDSGGGSVGFGGDAGGGGGFGGAFAGSGDSSAGSAAVAFSEAGAFAKAVAFSGSSPGYSPHLVGAPAPELSSLPLMMLGFAAIAWKLWKRRAA